MAGFRTPRRYTRNDTTDIQTSNLEQCLYDISLATDIVDARAFGGLDDITIAPTKEQMITAAIQYAAATGKSMVFVPKSMLPYNAGAVTTNASVQIIWEGSDYTFPILSTETGVVAAQYPYGDVRRFGAIEGSDSATALANAIASSQRVIIPDNFTLTLGSTVTITDPDKAIVGGTKSVIAASGASYNLITLASTAHRTKFHGLTFNGAAVDDTTQQFGIFSDLGADDCEVSGCFFGVESDVNPSLNDGIKINTGERWKVHDNTFKYLKGAIVGTGYGVLCGQAKGLIAHGNYFLGSSGNGRHAIYLSGGCTHCEVFGNVVDAFTSTAFPIYSLAGQPHGTDNRIQNNVIVGGGDITNPTGAAISCMGGCEDNVISNNTIDGFGGPGIYISEILTGETNNGNVVDSNTILNVWLYGVMIDGAINTDVTNNKIRDCSAASSGGYPGIQIQKSGSVVSANTRVLGNSVRGTGVRAGLSINQVDNTGTVAIGNDFPDGTVGKIILVVAGTPLVSLDNNVGIAEFVDAGDADLTAIVSLRGETIRYRNTLTANRTVTLSTTNAYTGAKFRIARTGLGAFTLDVGGLKTIPASTAAFVDVEYDGPATTWRLTGYGTL